MLGKLLSKEECAACRECCVFDRYSIWDTPLFDRECCEKIKALRPGTRFVHREGGFLFLPEVDYDQFRCPALGGNGCVLGDEKPFDCRIWPLMLMEKEGRTVIALSPVCETVAGKPAGAVMELLQGGLSRTIFAYAEKFPGAVRAYREGYPVLAEAQKSSGIK